MKLTKMRIDGKKIESHIMEQIAETLEGMLREVGFVTEATVKNSSRIDLGLHMRSFKVDVEMLGYNASLHPHRNYKKGYKRTSTPTWDQRVEYNDLLNEVLNAFNVSCNIKSMHYIIRDGSKAMTECDWINQKQHWEYENEMKGYRVVELSEVA